MGFIAHDFLSTLRPSVAEMLDEDIHISNKDAAFNNNLCDVVRGEIPDGTNQSYFKVRVKSSSLLKSKKIAIGLIGLNVGFNGTPSSGSDYGNFVLSVKRIGGPIVPKRAPFKVDGRWNQLDDTIDKAPNLINVIIIFDTMPTEDETFEFGIISLDSISPLSNIKYSFQKIFIGNCFDDLCFDFDNTVISKELTGNIQKTQAGGTVPITPQIIQRINTRINKVKDSDLFSYGSNYYGLSNLTNFNKWSPIIVSPFDYVDNALYSRDQALYMNNIVYGNLTSPISYRKINDKYWTYDLSVESEN